MSLGLRGSELFGLHWADIDFEAATLYVRRGVVYGVVGSARVKPRGAAYRSPNQSLSRFSSGTVKRPMQHPKTGSSPVRGQRVNVPTRAIPWSRGTRGCGGEGRDLRSGGLAYLPAFYLDVAHRQR